LGFNSTAKSVAGIIFSSDFSQVLLIKRRDVNIWVIPGGGVDPGETPAEAIVRECKEETGLSIKIERQVGIYTPINRLANYSYLYECSVVEGMPGLNDEVQGIGFFPLEKLPHPLFFLHRQWIEDSMLRLPGIIQKPLSQITYFKLLRYALCHPIQVFRMLFSRLGIPINTK